MRENERADGDGDGNGERKAEDGRAFWEHDEGFEELSKGVKDA